MNINLSIIRLALVALPGLIALKLYRKLRGSRPKKVWEDFIEILIFSLASYLIIALLSNLVASSSQRNSIDGLSKLFLDDKSKIEWPQIGWACLVGIALAFIAAYIHKFKLVFRLARLIKASDKQGDEDVWDCFHKDLGEGEDNWVLLRDSESSLSYHGYVRSYSESEKNREIVLQDVNVYHEDSTDIIYAVSKLYYSRPSHTISIEVPEKRKEKQNG